MNENQFYEDLLELPHIQVDAVEKTVTKIILTCHQTKQIGICPQCLQATRQVHQYTQRQARDLNILRKEVWLHIRVKNYVCIPCQRYFTEDFDFVESNKSYTKRQAKWIFLCCAKQPFTAVGSLLNIQAKTVERIYYEQGERQLQLAEKYAQVRRLGIDELAHRKGKKAFCCVLTDLDKNQQLDILPDRKKTTLIAHFEALGPDFCAQIESVSCAVFPPYIQVIEHCFPQACLVLDRFHIVKVINNALDTYRKNLRKEFPKEKVFKDIKWLLFKSRLTETEQQDLQAAFQKDKRLESLLVIRNKFHCLFDLAPTATWLYEELSVWKTEAEALHFTCLAPFFKTLTNWQQYIANFAATKLTNAATEGLNNIIRYVKRISFGLPNFQHMRLRVLLHDT